MTKRKASTSSRRDGSPEISPRMIALPHSESAYDSFIKNFNSIMRGEYDEEMTPRGGGVFMTQPGRSPVGGGLDFGYNEKEQIKKENEMRTKRFKVTHTKKRFLNLDDDKVVDLAKFEELKSYIRDQEMLNAKREEHGAVMENDQEYSQRKMGLYKKYFFRLISKTTDPFITAKHEAYINSLIEQASPSFYKRMNIDKQRRTNLKDILTKMTSLTSTRSPAPSPSKDASLAQTKRSVSFAP